MVGTASPELPQPPSLPVPSRSKGKPSLAMGVPEGWELQLQLCPTGTEQVLGGIGFPPPQGKRLKHNPDPHKSPAVPRGGTF